MINESQLYGDHAYEKELERAKESVYNDIDSIKKQIDGFRKDWIRPEKCMTESNIKSWLFYIFLIGDNDHVVYESEEERAFEIPNELTDYAFDLLMQYDDIALELL